MTFLLHSVTLSPRTAFLLHFGTLSPRMTFLLHFGTSSPRSGRTMYSHTLQRVESWEEQP